jgi:hypothetical protein
MFTYRSELPRLHADDGPERSVACICRERPGEASAMGVLEQRHVDETRLSLDENEELLRAARKERVQHEAMLRRADRRIRAGLDLIRRGTLRLITK